MKNLNQGINIFIDEHSVKQTEFSANIYAGNANNIIKLSLSYIYIQIFAEYNGNINYYEVYHYFGVYISSDLSNSYIVTLTAPNDFNLTGGAKVISFISGMSM
jgi:hypothetical protein